MSKKPGIFIDRDGTLNVEVDFLSRPEDVALISGSAEAIAKLNARNIPVIVITNQSGIGRGLFGWDEFNVVSKKIDKLLAMEDACLNGVYVCPFHEDGLPNYRHKNHPDRKPNPGMLLRAAEEHCIDLNASWMIGDKEIDLKAGRNAGCKTALVLTGYGKSVNTEEADIVAEDLAKAIEKILSICL